MVFTIDITTVGGDIRLIHKQCLFSLAQLIPVPITDWVVQIVGDVVNHQFLLWIKFIQIRVTIICIFVFLYINQLNPAMRCSGNSQWQIYRLAIGIRCSRISRDILVIDIDRALDVPVVGGHSIVSHILVTNIVAVVNNGLRTVYEVTRGLPFPLIVSRTIVFNFGVFIIRINVYIVPLGDSTCVQGSQSGMLTVRFSARTMHVLGIDETTAHTLLHVDEVQFDDTRDEAPVLLIKILTNALLSSQFQINARCQSHLVVAVTIVAFAIVLVVCFPAIESLSFRVWIWTVSLCVDIVGGTYITIRIIISAEIKVAGQGTKVVHNTVDTEVITVLLA